MREIKNSWASCISLLSNWLWFRMKISRNLAISVSRTSGSSDSNNCWVTSSSESWRISCWDSRTSWVKQRKELMKTGRANKAWRNLISRARAMMKEKGEWWSSQQAFYQEQKPDSAPKLKPFRISSIRVCTPAPVVIIDDLPVETVTWPVKLLTWIMAFI